MRKFAYIFVLLLWVVNSPLWSASRLSPDENHYLALWGQAGYATMLSNSKNFSTGPGVSPAVGIGYRYFRNGLIVQTGLEGQYSYLTTSVKNSDFVLNMRDTEGDKFVLTAHVNNQKDITQVVHLNIPVMVGYEYKRFYMMAGASFGICLYGNAQAKASLALLGRYAEFIDPFEDMPNHQLENDRAVNSEVYKVKWRSPSINVHAEVGGRVDKIFVERHSIFDPKPKSRIYVAVYADYGVMNVRTNSLLGQTLSYKQTYGQPLTFEALPLMVSQQLRDTKLSPLVVGVKATFLFELPKEHLCVICKDDD